MQKRVLHVAPDGAAFAAHMPGFPFVGAGRTELDAIQEVLENVPNLLIQNVDIIRTTGPIPAVSAPIEASYTIEVRRDGSGDIVADLIPFGCATTNSMSELHALSELLTASPHVLRRGCRLEINLFGRESGEHFQVVMHRNGHRGYTATLGPDAVANEGGTPREALMNLLTTVPQVFQFGSRITVLVLRDVPVTFKEDMTWGL